jgi:hypothetical protein
MKKSMHNNESIPVTITRVREQTNNEKRGKQVLCGHDDQAGYIYKFIQ